jgi:hypothetical protein
MQISDRRRELPRLHLDGNLDRKRSYPRETLPLSTVALTDFCNKRTGNFFAKHHLLFTRKDTVMNKFLSLLVAAVALGCASVASARTVTRYHAAAASDASTAESFQNNWNVSY